MELGYSCSGTVIAVGEEIKTFRPGDFVACAGAGIANHAEQIVVPKNLAVKLPNNSFLKQASLTTIGAIALQGIRRANLQLGETVCVFGLGLIGQITVQLAKQAGCNVFGIDIDDKKIALAQKLGCSQTYNAKSETFLHEMAFHTQHHGVDATLVTASSPSGNIIQQAMEITRRKGKVVLVGSVKIDFNRSPFYEKEIDFLISCSYGPGRYDQKYEQEGYDYPYAYARWTENRNMQLFANMIFAKQIDINPLITSEFSFEQAEQAYFSLRQHKSLGILLRYKQESSVLLDTSTFAKKLRRTLEETDLNANQLVRNSFGSVSSSGCVAGVSRSTKFKPYKAPEGILNVACIGAGGFAKIKLLPLLSKNKNVKISTIIDTNPANAINVAKQYKAQVNDNDIQKVIADESINVAVIATPHAFHAQQTIDLLSAGKAVFVEKPAATSYEQLEQLKTFLDANPKSLYCVDFNRSFAPFITKIKKAVLKRTTPLIIHYRMNAGFIPKKHWIQSQKHGGRIIGEACHIFELFNFLTGSIPVNISASAINTSRDDILPSDNFSTTITFADGSLCTLLYTAIGNKKLPKERMEIYFDGKSIVMDDYKTLTGYGVSLFFDTKTKTPDKGHKILLNKFIDAAKSDGASPISPERILLATKISLQVNELIQEPRIEIRG